MQAGRFFGLALAITTGSLSLVMPAYAQVTEMPSPGAVTPPEVYYGQPVPEGVLQRARPELQPQGVVLEGLQWLPSITPSATYDTNIFATQSHATGDFVFRTRPEIDVRSLPEAGPITMNLDGYVQDVRYGNHGSLGHDDFGGTLDLGGDFEPTGRLASHTAFNYYHQDPASFAISSANGALHTLPVEKTFIEDLTGTHDVGLLGLALNGGYERDEFQNFTINGVTFNQKQLNDNAVKFGPKLSYEVSPGLRPFVAGQYIRRFYDHGVFDSNSYAFTGGSDFDIHELIRGTAYAGYDVRDYDSSAIGTVNGFTYGLNLSWFPTELLTLTFSGGQNFSDTVITSSNGTPSVLDAKTVRGEADYELLRQVILSGVVAYENDNYTQVSRTDNIVSAGASVK